MVAGGRCDYATLEFLGGQLRQLVVGAANLEGVHRLQILALEQDLVAQTLGKLTGGLKGGFHGDVVDARGKDLLDVLFEHDGSGGGGTENRQSNSTIST